MTFQVKLSADEVKAIIAAHLTEKLSMPVTADDLSGESYSCGLTLGKYDSYEFPPKPKKLPVAVPAAEQAIVTTDEAKPAEQPF